MTQLWCLQPWLDSGRTRSRIVTTDIVVMKLGSALDFKFVACCSMPVAGRPVSQQFDSFRLPVKLSQMQNVKPRWAETDIQCIAHSGVISENLLTDDSALKSFKQLNDLLQSDQSRPPRVLFFFLIRKLPCVGP